MFYIITTIEDIFTNL